MVGVTNEVVCQSGKGLLSKRRAVDFIYVLYANTRKEQPWNQREGKVAPGMCLLFPRFEQEGSWGIERRVCVWQERNEGWIDGWLDVRVEI